MAWGSGGFKSCDALLQRVESNDPKLTELVILPMKTFGASDLERLSGAIANGKNTNLQSISASGHILPPESLKDFGLALSAQAKNITQNNDDTLNSGITSLAIGSKDMGDEGVIALCEGLEYCFVNKQSCATAEVEEEDGVLEESNGALLQYVDFGWKNIGKDGMKAIGKTFASSTSLKSINLSRNEHVGNEGISAFSIAAMENVAKGMVAFPSLETLVLSECNIGPEDLQSLADMILGTKEGSNRTKPIQLAISSNPINAEGCSIVSNLFAIPGNASVVSHLQILQCSIGDEGLKSLSSAAMTNPCNGLSILDMSENSITQDGAKMFAQSLVESWPDLVELKLAKNELGSEGIGLIMGALSKRCDQQSSEECSDKKNSTLQNVDLSSTNCGVEGAKAALMSGNLHTLRLFGNRIGSEGFEAISSLLIGGHPTIENLDLGGNDAEEDAVVELLNAIANKEGCTFESKLAVLEIGGNKFGDRAMEALNELKRVWPHLDVAHDKPVQEGEESDEPNIINN